MLKMLDFEHFQHDFAHFSTQNHSLRAWPAGWFCASAQNHLTLLDRRKCTSAQCALVHLCTLQGGWVGCFFAIEQNQPTLIAHRQCTKVKSALLCILCTFVHSLQSGAVGWFCAFAQNQPTPASCRLHKNAQKCTKVN